MIIQAFGPCAKQLVIATIVASNGMRFFGSNHCFNPQLTCPRVDMPSGVGYELCVKVCNQPAHAEVNAIQLAGEHACGAVLYLEGHTHACPACQVACDEAGITKIIIGAPPPIKEIGA